MEFIETGSGPTTALFFHGYGADMNDLAGMTPAIPGGESFRWIFPNGPEKIPLGPHMMGRAWFHIDIEEYERAMREGRQRDMSRRRPGGLDKAVKLAMEFIEDLKLNLDQLVIGGFSQGAMLAVEVLCRLEKNCAAAVLLSGNLIDEANLLNMAPKRKNQKFYQSHGTHDAILSFELAQQLEKTLIGCGWKGHLDVFRGGHEIPQSVIGNLGHFLANLDKAKGPV